MSETGAVGAVESKTVGYVVRGTYGGEYARREGREQDGQHFEWHSSTPTHFSTVEEAVTAIIHSGLSRGATIERVVETTHTTTKTETKTEYQPL